MSNGITVGQLRQLLAAFPDDNHVYVDHDRMREYSDICDVYIPSFRTDGVVVLGMDTLDLTEDRDRP